MEKYRAYIHYHFKKGMEEQGMKFIESELIKHAKQYGCHAICLWQDERDPSHVLGTGDWNSLQEAKAFQSHWDKKETELGRFLTNLPTREFFKVRKSYQEKSRKAA